jgi:hypothetical protein
MPKTQVSCPKCHQPVLADVNQLFDVNVDPSAKARLLSGVVNLIQCPVCGFQGNLASPIVYHDADKELLLTYIPPELGIPRNEQERMIGNLINQVINKLPQEKRKGYLLNPQTTLTFQGLIERVLEADGITKEMIQAQQQRLSLIQRLASASDESVRTEIAKQEDEHIDAEFFALLSRLAETALVNGDRESAQQLADLQKSLLPITTYGQQVQAQTKEIEAAITELRDAGKELTREKILELVINAPNDVRLSTLVSYARPLMDYTFFQMLSERIDRARTDGRARLIELRSKLLEMTQAIDRQVEEHVRQTREVINKLMQADDVAVAMEQTLVAVDEFFIREVNQLLEEARRQGDLAKSGKLQKMLEVIQQASAPPELALIEKYLDSPDEQSMKEFLEVNKDAITPEFLDLLANIAVQMQSGEDKEFAQHVMLANRQALRFSMERNISNA